MCARASKESSESGNNKSWPSDKAYYCRAEAKDQPFGFAANLWTLDYHKKTVQKALVTATQTVGHALIFVPLFLATRLRVARSIRGQWTLGADPKTGDTVKT